MEKPPKNKPPLPWDRQAQLELKARQAFLESPAPTPRGKFLVNGIIISAILAYIFYSTGTPLLNVEANMPPEMQAVRHSLIEVDGKGLEQLVASKDGRPTLLYVYASWCPYCKKQYPVIDALAKQKDAKAHMVALSIDESPYKLTKFLMEHKAAYTPYQVKDGSQISIAMTLREKGAGFQGGIPYMAVFNGKGQLLREFMGVTPIEDLQKAWAENPPQPGT